MKKVGDHYDYNIRQWVLDSAIAANKKGSSAAKILNDAKTFYGWVVNNGVAADIKVLNKELT